jgi:hypothetical protein
LRRLRSRLRIGKLSQVLAFIHSGELSAVNVARPGARRALFRISEEGFAAFLERRLHMAASKPAHAPRRQPVKATQYF